MCPGTMTQGFLIFIQTAIIMLRIASCFWSRTLAMFLLLLCAAALSSQETKLSELRGTIRELDLKTGVVTLQLLPTPTQRELSLAAKDLPVTNPLGQIGKLADLREELRITAKVRNDDEIIAIRVDGPYLYGVIRSIDQGKKSVVLKDEIADKTIVVPADAKLIVHGKDGTLNQCKVGDPIQVLYSLDHEKILQVQLGKGALSRDPFRHLVRNYGILTEVEPVKRRVEVFVQSTDVGLLRNYPLSSQAYLRLMYHTKPVSDVGFDQFARLVKVSYIVDRDSGKIVNMDADLPTMVRRKVLKFDLPARTITVEDETKEKTLILDPQAKIWTPRGDGKWADVTPKRIVSCGLTLDRNRVLLVYLWDK
jgi:hypothetical protein